MPWLLFALLAQADPPGTVKLVSKTSFLIDTQNGDAYFLTTPEEPARFSITGPAKVQVDFRVNLPKKKGKETKPVLLEVVADGRTLSKLRINAKAGRSSWRKSEVAYKPSEAAEFFLDLAEGTHDVEFNLDAKLGGALYLVETTQASRPLAADAPALKIAATAPGAVPATPPVASAQSPQSTAAPSPDQPPSTAETKPLIAKPAEPPPPEITEKPAEPKPSSDQRHLLGVVAMGGVAVQEEKLAFPRTGAGDVLASLQFALPKSLHAELGWEARFGTIAVPLANGLAATATPEVRHALWIGFGWAPTVWKRGDMHLDLSLTAFYRLAVHSNQIAPALFGVAGGEVGVQFSRGFATVFANGGFAPRLHDSTPASVSTGGIVGRAHWAVGVRADILSMLGVIVAYRGELLLRTGAFRQSDGVQAGFIVSFL